MGIQDAADKLKAKLRRPLTADEIYILSEGFKAGINMMEDHIQIKAQEAADEVMSGFVVPDINLGIVAEMEATVPYRTIPD